MTDPLRFIPQRVPLVDPRTGLVHREWYLFLQGLFIRAGGANGVSTDTLAESMPADDGTEEAKAAIYANAVAAGTLPPVVERDQTLDLVLAELSAQRDLITELMKTVVDMQQQPSL